MSYKFSCISQVNALPSPCFLTFRTVEIIVCMVSLNQTAWFLTLISNLSCGMKVQVGVSCLLILECPVIHISLPILEYLGVVSQYFSTWLCYVSQYPVLSVSCLQISRYLLPPNTWVSCSLESRELLRICLTRLKGLSKVHLIDAGFVWTEPHSKRIKVKLSIQKEASFNVIIKDSVLGVWPFCVYSHPLPC